jgi:hypothetical protein
MMNDNTMDDFFSGLFGKQPPKREDAYTDPLAKRYARCGDECMAIAQKCREALRPKS